LQYWCIPKALRGGVKAGMPNIVGYSDNKHWKVFRACFFTWNRNPHELKKLLKFQERSQVLEIRLLV
tara:strand:- start:1608 stop:1808 length:201 start_codon:yes stop_codon:yes gene_type:complete